MTKQYTVSRLEAQRSVKFINSVVRFLRKLGFHTWELDRDKILRKAKRKTGLTNWGEENFIEVLDKIIENSRSLLSVLGK